MPFTDVVAFRPDENSNGETDKSGRKNGKFRVKEEQQRGDIYEFEMAL